MRGTVLLLSLLLTVVVAGAAGDLAERAERLDNQLMSPCCMTNTLAVHESGTSQRIRTEIREMLAAGKTDKEILDHYVAEYGPQILSTPEARGFNLMAYFFAPLFLILSTIALFVVMSRWKRREVAEVPAAPKIDEQYAERLDRELAKLD